MNKHTPGPWTVGEFEVLVRNQRTVNPSICTVFGTEQETLLNARLIAAAPELLEALEFLLTEADRQTVLRQDDGFLLALGQARSIIAKAKCGSDDGVRYTDELKDALSEEWK